MKALRIITMWSLVLLLLCVSQTLSAPKSSFPEEELDPQAMLYLKGTQGRRFISENRKEGDVYDTLHLESRSQNTGKLNMDQAATILLNFLQDRDQGDETSDTVYFQELPVWKREYF
ncbi:spexin prohormone 1 [Gouania willdenowi]|uniref:spexin prohormone 1 n=1 Tax=Gouania willdenowi TaxID=441366 RepID=UPI0010557B48|nr:spexin [Gouania willdenowi]